MDPCQGRININKRHKCTNTKFIRVLSAACLIHQSIWIAPHILTLPGDGRKTSVEAQSIQWLKWNSASAIPPTGLLYKSNNAAQVYSKSSRGRIFTLAPESWVCLSAQYLKERKKKERDSVGAVRAERFVITVTQVKWGAVKEEMLHLCLCSQRRAGPGYLKASVTSS